MSDSSTRAVSFDSEELILVDKDDQEVGTLRKDACHNGDGVLHRAFSAFLFNAAGDVLLQQRAPGKRLWPGFWSNSCCSHPRAGETLDFAVARRLNEELGIEADVQFVYKFVYQANFEDLGAEHECCSVFVGRLTGEVLVNPTEISAWRYVSPKAFEQELLAYPARFTPWCRQEWQALTTDYSDHLQGLTELA